MMEQQRSWIFRRAEESLRQGFEHAYDTVKVEPQRFLVQLQAAYGLPISSFQGVYSLNMDLLDGLSSRIEKSGMKMAALEGAGLGLGGILTVIPDLSILASITLRTVQKLSLLYGFEYNTDDEITELWIAAASAAGVDISRELIEKEVVSRFVPRVIRRIAVQASSDIVEKWSGRLIPVASSAIGATLNYYFVRAWAERARSHFRSRHLEIRGRMEAQRTLAPVAEPPRLS